MPPRLRCKQKACASVWTCISKYTTLKQPHYGYIKCLKKYFTKILAWNIMFFSALNNPKSPWYLNPFKAEFNKTYRTAKLNKTFTLISHSFSDQQLKGSFYFYLIKFALHCPPIFEHKICIETSVLQSKDQIDWDSATLYNVFYRLLSTSYFRKLVY